MRMSSDYEILVDEASKMHRQLEAALNVCRHLVAWKKGNYARLPILRCVVLAQEVLAMTDGSPPPSRADYDELTEDWPATNPPAPA